MDSSGSLKTTLKKYINIQCWIQFHGVPALQCLFMDPNWVRNSCPRMEFQSYLLSWSLEIFETFIHQVLIECLPCARNYRALGYREEDNVIEETDKYTVTIQNRRSGRRSTGNLESTEDDCLIPPWGGIKRVLDLCVM